MGDHYYIWVGSILQRGPVSCPHLEDATLARMRRKGTLVGMLVLCIQPAVLLINGRKKKERRNAEGSWMVHILRACAA